MLQQVGKRFDHQIHKLAGYLLLPLWMALFPKKPMMLQCNLLQGPNAHQPAAQLVSRVPNRSNGLSFCQASNDPVEVTLFDTEIELISEVWDLTV